MGSLLEERSKATVREFAHHLEAGGQTITHRCQTTNPCLPTV
jgi:hypothetical protein